MKRSFTMIEVGIIIVIITLLSFTAVPNLLRLRYQERCKQVGIGEMEECLAYIQNQKEQGRQQQVREKEKTQQPTGRF